MSKCNVESCEKGATYKAQGVCQMHYFRMMRTGAYELRARKRKERVFDDRGYILMLIPHHKLASKRGLIREHTVVAYEKYGDTLPPCELCGKPLAWGMGRSMHIDHIDENKSNNNPRNLRPLCNGCNSSRGLKDGSRRMPNALYLSFNGEEKSSLEWAKDSRVAVSSSTIKRRKRKGMSDEAALFSRKKTHKVKELENESNRLEETKDRNFN